MEGVFLPKLDKTYNIQALNGLLEQIVSKYNKDSSYRLTKEEEWLENLRQYKGIYDPETELKIKKNRSHVYTKYTASKVNSIIAKANHIAIPSIGKNWEINPSPQPRIKQEILDKIVMSMSQKDEMGNIVPPPPDVIQKGIMQYAEDAAHKMERLMFDQLKDNNYNTKIKRMIKSGVIYGTGILKGVLSTSKTITELKKKDETKIAKFLSLVKGDRTQPKYEQIEKVIYQPYFDNVQLWRFFPDMSVTEFEDAAHVNTLESMPKHDLLKVAEEDDFFTDEIYDYIRDNPKGSYKIQTWEQIYRTLKDNNIGFETNNYEVLKFDGYLSSNDLFEAGVIEEDNPQKELFVNIWVLEKKKIIKASIYEDITIPELYHLFYFKKDETSVFGEGSPRDYRDTQISICSTSRAMLDNAAITAFPIVEMNFDPMDRVEDVEGITPGMLLKRQTTGMAAQYPMVRIHAINNHTGEYLAMLDKFERQGDVESGFPAFFSGEPLKSGGEPAKVQYNREKGINIILDDVVKQFDDANSSFLKSLYKWNMLHSEDEGVKGDMDIVAIGSSSILAKEVRAEAIDNFKKTLLPDELPYLKTKEMLIESMDGRDLDYEKLLRTDEEVQAIIEQRQDKEMEMLQKQAIAGKTDYDAAKADAMRAKAAERMAVTPHKADEAAINNDMKRMDIGKKELDMAKTVHQSGLDSQRLAMEQRRQDIENLDLTGEIARKTSLPPEIPHPEKQA